MEIYSAINIKLHQFHSTELFPLVHMCSDMTLINEKERRPKKLDKVILLQNFWVQTRIVCQGDLLGGGGDVRQPGNLHPARSGPVIISVFVIWYSYLYLSIWYSFVSF